MMHMRLLKGPLHIPILFSEIQVTLGSFVKPFSAITQFASKDSYFELNIKKVCRSILEVKKHILALYLIYIISHVPS